MVLPVLLALGLLCQLVHGLNYTGHGFNDTDNGHNQTNMLKPLFPKPSNSTPRFRYLDIEEQMNANPRFKVASSLTPGNFSKRATAAATDETGTCAPGSPCSNGACCSNKGVCGYSPDYCGTGNCISNCNAKASCGKYAAAENRTCPLNVCCVSLCRFFPP